MVGAAVGAMVLGGFLMSAGLARATQGGGDGGPTAQAPSRDYEPGVLLVGFRSGTGEAKKSKAEAHHGSAVDERIPSINVDRVRLTPGKDVLAAAREFKNERDVVFAEPNYRAHADLDPPNDLLQNQQWGPQKIQALQAHGVVYPSTYPTYSAGANASGITHPLIAVVDTGIAARAGDAAANPDLIAKVSGLAADCTLTSTFATEHCPTSVPYDDYGHGTHVAGIAGAETNNGAGIVGVAPGAELVSIKVLDSTGSGYYSWIASGVLCAADLGTCGLGPAGAHADVINMSLGGSTGSSTLQSAIASAQSAGVVVVSAAGNSGTSSVSYPGAYSDLSVIATDNNDSKASWSNYGGYPNQVSAPGVNILSTVSKNTAISISSSSGYSTLSGTSMATPHVAGLAALLAGQGLARGTIVTRIKTTADPLPSAASPDPTNYGAGRINALRAVSAAAPPAPDFSLTASPSSQSVVQGAGTTYTATVTPSGGFSGTVALSATGLPGGATASFSPTSLSAGTSTMTVTTASSTPTGSYPVTVTGTSGMTTHSASVTLVVTPPADFTISISPSSRSITRGSRTGFTVTITRTGNLTGAVSFSVSGLPSGARGSFSPNPTTGASTTLTVRTSSTTTRGTSGLTVTATGGGLSRTGTASLQVR